MFAPISETAPVTPGRRSRKRPIRHYLDRWRIEGAFYRLKEFRRIATSTPCANLLSTVVLAAVIGSRSE